MKHPEYKTINKSFRKKDSKQLLLGKPVYTNDVTNNKDEINKILTLLRNIRLLLVNQK